MRHNSPGWKPDNLDARILELWRKGMDTFDIAESVGRDEAQVYKRLWHVRSAK